MLPALVLASLTFTAAPAAPASAAGEPTMSHVEAAARVGAVAGAVAGIVAGLGLVGAQLATSAPTSPPPSTTPRAPSSVDLAIIGVAIAFAPVLLYDGVLFLGYAAGAGGIVVGGLAMGGALAYDALTGQLEPDLRFLGLAE